MNANVKNIEIDGVAYRVGKLNAITQFHLVRRLVPVLAEVGISIEQVRQVAAETPDDETMASFLPKLKPIMKLMAEMPDSQVDYVMHTCLGMVARISEGRAQVVMVDGRLMFEDLKMPHMLRLVMEVLRFNLSGFFGELGAETTSPSS